MEHATVRLLAACARLRWKKTTGPLADAVRAWQNDGCPRDILEQSTDTLLRQVRVTQYKHTAGSSAHAVKSWHEAGCPDATSRRTFPQDEPKRTFGMLPCPSCETLTDLRVCPDCSCTVRG